VILGLVFLSILEEFGENRRIIPRKAKCGDCWGNKDEI
jgi:hypothetical protein